MNASLRDLKQHVDETPPPPVDVERIVARGEARLRRRRAALVAGSASLAVLAIATGVIAKKRVTSELGARSSAWQRGSRHERTVEITRVCTVEVPACPLRPHG